MLKSDNSYRLYLIIHLLLVMQIVNSLDSSVIEIGADVLHKSDITGKGYGVCIIDTGIYYPHENLGDCNENQFLNGQCRGVKAGYDFGHNDTNPIELSTFLNNDSWHGTFASGIVISNHGVYKGVAPDANIGFVKISKDNQTSSAEEIFVNAREGIQWCIDNKEALNISVISMSFGFLNESSVGYSLSTCPDYFNLKPKIDMAIENDILVIAAAGNRNPQALQALVLTPACLGNVTAIGSSDGNSLASNSRTGDALDLLAPGTLIRSTSINGNFQIATGTSFATPHVAAAVTLIREYDSAIKCPIIERILKDSGKEVSTPLFTGYRIIDLPNALHFNDWPLFLHDLKRSGVTKLKGDIPGSGITFSPHNFGVGGTNALDKMGIAKVQKNDNDLLDIILTSSTGANQGKVYVASYYDPEWHYGQYVWSEFNLDVLYNTNAGFVGSPTIVDVKGGFLFGGKEVIFSTGDDIVHAISSKESAMEDFYEL